MMTEKAPISDFNFAQGSAELTPFEVSTLLQQYSDGRRKFNQIDLKNGNLSDAHLPYIHLEESLLYKADLRNAILAGASLNHIDLSSSNLSRTNLIAADLIRAKLAGANLMGAFLSGANLSGANLRKCNLTDCTLAGANLSGVDFTGAILKNTNMAGATLRGANLSAVDLSDVNLAELNLDGSILPADHHGAAWAALRPGEVDELADITTQDEPSQDLPEAYPLDAFDDSYDALIQDLAENSGWLNANAGVAAASTEFSATDAADSASSGSPFDPFAAPGAGEDASLNSMALIPFQEEDPTHLDQETHFIPPVDRADDPANAVDKPASPTADHRAEASHTADDAHTPSATPLNTPDAEVSPTDETVPMTSGQYDFHQHPRQEEVVKSIQAVLNRRTHTSLKRKLLEVYGKRCAITDCALVPLLDTVLIDSRDRSVADHPSNGLVLRNDIKTLYELHLIAIHPTDLTVMLAPSLRSSGYGYLQGKKINLPKQSIYHPAKPYLQAHLDHCKWATYGADAQTLQAVDYAATPGITQDDAKGQKSDLITRVALLAGGVVLGGTLMGLLWALLPPGPAANMADAGAGGTESSDEQASPIPAVTVDPDHRISLQLGPLRYPLGGVIYDGGAYLAVAQLQQAGVISAAPAATEMIRVDGQDFVAASYVRDLAVALDWNADTRTVTLDCCSDPEIEPIIVAVEGQSLSDEGLIIEGSSYAPVAVFDPLNLAPVQVSANDFVGVDDSFYVKANGLKPLDIDLVWDPESRTLNLVP